MITAPDRNRDGVVAIVVVTPELAAKWHCEEAAAGSTCAIGSEESCKAVPAGLEQEILTLLQQAAADGDVKPYETPVAVVVEWRQWQHPEQITLTGKVTCLVLPTFSVCNRLCLYCR